jgi:hypothetical protein
MKPIDYRYHPRNPAAQPFNVAPKPGKKKNAWWKKGINRKGE